MKTILFALVCLLMILGSVSAQNEIAATVLYVDSGNYPEIKVYLTVIQSNRQIPVTDLTPEDFFVDTDSGDPLTVLNVNRSLRPLHAVVVLDLTGSVSADELANEVAAVKALAEQLDANDQLGLVTMDDQNAQMLAPLQSNPDLSVLDSLAPTPDATGNVFWDGVHAALTLLQASPSDIRRAIIIMSDVSPGGGSGTKSEEAALATAIEQGIEVFGLYFEHEGDGIPDNPPLLPPELTIISEGTGGITLGTAADLISQNDYRDDDALPVMMGTVAALVTNELQLTLLSPHPANGSPMGMNINITYQGITLPPIRSEFTAGNSLQPATPPPNTTQGLGVTLVDVPSAVEVDQPIIITAQIGQVSAVQSIAFRVNGEDRELRTQGPFDRVTFDWQPSQTGTFEIEVIVRDNAGNIATQKTQIEVRGKTAGAVSGKNDNNLGIVLVALGAFIAGMVLLFGSGGLFLLWRRSKTPLLPPARQPSTEPPSAPSEPLSPLLTAEHIAIPPPPQPVRAKTTEQPVAELRGANGEQWTVYEGDNTIGRHGSNRIQIKDESTSRYHARIEVIGGKCFFSDWQASHPSEINGVLLKPNTRYELKNGDTIRIGSHLLRFQKL
jgi:hypothetical protein